MSLTRVWLLACLSAVLFFGAFDTAADIGPLYMFKGGEGVAPRSSHWRIRLDSQKVMIRLKPWTYAVNVQFNLFNEGEAVTEWIGFPKWVASTFDCYPRFTTFKGSLNGKEIEFVEEEDSASRRRFLWTRFSRDLFKRADKSMKRQRQWMVSRVTFPGHAQTSICVTYEARYYGKFVRNASYVYGTGSLWKGNIGRAVFIVDSTQVGGTQNTLTFFRKGIGPGLVYQDTRSPPRVRPIGKNVLCFEMTDFEPDPGAHLSIWTNWMKGRFLRKPNYV